MASRDDPEQARPVKPPDPMDPEHSSADDVIRELTAQSLPFGRVIDFGDPDGPVDILGDDVTRTPHGFLVGLVTPEQRTALDEALESLRSAFAFSLSDLTGYTGIAGPFQVTPPGVDAPSGSTIVKQRRMSPRDIDIADENLVPLRDAGIIERCYLYDHGANLVVAAKKDALTGAWTDKRVCQDFRPVNLLTPSDKHSLPLPEQLHQAVGSSRFLTKIDLRSGFHQIPIPEDRRHLTAFWWNGELWQYARAPFGLKNMPSHFQRIMDQAIQGAGLGKCFQCYLDDLLIHSDSFDQHLVDVRRALEMLIANGLRAHPQKSIFCAQVLEYRGHNISFHGILLCCAGAT